MLSLPDNKQQQAHFHWAFQLTVDNLYSLRMRNVRIRQNEYTHKHKHTILSVWIHFTTLLQQAIREIGQLARHPPYQNQNACRRSMMTTAYCTTHLHANIICSRWFLRKRAKMCTIICRVNRTELHSYRVYLWEFWYKHTHESHSNKQQQQQHVRISACLSHRRRRRWRRRRSTRLARGSKRQQTSVC